MNHSFLAVQVQKKTILQHACDAVTGFVSYCGGTSKPTCIESVRAHTILDAPSVVRLMLRHTTIARCSFKKRNPKKTGAG